MANKVFKRLFTLMLAVVMVLASSMAVLAADTGTSGNSSPGHGETETEATIEKQASTVNANAGTAKVFYSGKNNASYKILYKLRNQSWGDAKIITTDNKNYVLTQLQKGGLYDIRVAGVNSNGVQGKWSEITRRLMSKTLATGSSKNGKVTVKLPKTKNATAYRIMYSTSSDFSNAKMAGQSAKCTTRTISGLTKGKTYYFKVYPIAQTPSGATYTGESTTFSVKVK